MISGVCAIYGALFLLPNKIEATLYKNKHSYQSVVKWKYDQPTYHHEKSAYAMMISLLSSQINEVNSKLWVENVQAFLDAFARQSTITKFREYRLILNHKEHRIRVPIVEEAEDYTLYWPAGLLRRRPYPLAVYLFAVCIYLAGGLSMREAALITRKQFGLATFSHSTLSRTKRKLFDLLQNFAEEPPISASSTEDTSLVCRLRRMLDGLTANPFTHAEKLALHFYHQYQVFLL